MSILANFADHHFVCIFGISFLYSKRCKQNFKLHFLHLFSLILTLSLPMFQSHQSNVNRTYFCLFIRTLSICKQNIFPFQFSQNMFVLCRSFISKRKGLSKRGRTLSKWAKTKKITKGTAPPGAQISKMLKHKKWNFSLHCK